VTFIEELCNDGFIYFISLFSWQKLIHIDTSLVQVHMISFQCSPLSTPEGIVATFQQCAQLQHEKDLERYVATVVLDEVGLAEDSPLMPLKVLMFFYLYV